MFVWVVCFLCVFCCFISIVYIFLYYSYCVCFTYVCVLFCICVFLLCYFIYFVCVFSTSLITIIACLWCTCMFITVINLRFGVHTFLPHNNRQCMLYNYYIFSFLRHTCILYNIEAATGAAWLRWIKG